MTQTQKNRSGGAWVYLVALIVAAGLVGAVFSLASRAARVPPLPRVAFADGELERAEAAIRNRAKGFAPTGSEGALKEKLVAVHLTETELAPAQQVRSSVEGAIVAFRQAAKEAVAADEDRYLLMGDALAVSFDQALSKTLALAGQQGLQESLRRGGPEVEELKLSGGAFILKAIEKGLVTDSGELKTYRIIPMVLFEARWRHLADLPLVYRLSGPEQRAYWDFSVAFAGPGPEAMGKRLKAVAELAQLDDGYDRVIARAIVLQQGGDLNSARAELEAAARAGRRDRTVNNFLRALEK